MSILNYFFLILVLMILFIFYQTKDQPFDVRTYLDRFFYLVKIIYTYFKDVGLQAAVLFKQIDWDVTKMSQTNPPSTHQK